MSKGDAISRQLIFTIHGADPRNVHPIVFKVVNNRVLPTIIQKRPAFKETQIEYFRPLTKLDMETLLSKLH